MVGQGAQVYRHPKLHFAVRSVPERGGGSEGEKEKKWCACIPTNVLSYVLMVPMKGVHAVHAVASQKRFDAVRVPSFPYPKCLRSCDFDQEVFVQEAIEHAQSTGHANFQEFR